MQNSGPLLKLPRIANNGAVATAPSNSKITLEIIMKKTLLILITTFLLTGCSGNITTSEALPSEESNTQAQTMTDISKEEKSPATLKESVKTENTHEYFCDKFILTVDDKQFDLSTIVPEISSVSELYPITDEQLYILGRIDEKYNALIIYDFTTEEFIFSEAGTTMCWVQNKFETVRYLKDNIVYDLDGTIIYQAEDSRLISMIEYVAEDFMVTVTNLNYENPEEIWIK